MIFTIAIDGPAASGKGTIARQLAARYGFAHLDTGKLYRAVGVIAAERGDPADPALSESVARGLRPDDLDRDDLRSREAGEAASVVAAQPQVRAALVAFQRLFARRDGGAVLDGRDIGTVICPHAEVKLFVEAAPETRAARRAAELGADPEEILADLRRRDARDSQRAEAPLAAAADAVLIDTTALSIEAAVAKAADVVEERIARVRAERA